MGGLKSKLSNRTVKTKQVGTVVIRETPWELNVLIKDDFGVPFPCLPSNLATAVILSYLAYENEVCLTLMRVNQTCRAYIVKQKGVPGFLIKTPPWDKL